MNAEKNRGNLYSASYEGCLTHFMVAVMLAFVVALTLLAIFNGTTQSSSVAQHWDYEKFVTTALTCVIVVLTVFALLFGMAAVIGYNHFKGLIAENIGNAVRDYLESERGKANLNVHVSEVTAQQRAEKEKAEEEAVKKAVGGKDPAATSSDKHTTEEGDGEPLPEYPGSQ